MRSRLLLGLAFVLAALSASCQRGDPAQHPVTAATVTEFTRWRTGLSDKLSAEQWREFDLVVQEIKLRVMADKEATGSEAVDAAMRKRIHGKTLSQVLALGTDYKIQRLTADRAELARTLEQNTSMRGKAGDTAAGKHLDSLRERQQARLERLDAEIAGLQQRLKGLNGTGAAAASGVSAPDKAR